MNINSFILLSTLLVSLSIIGALLGLFFLTLELYFLEELYLLIYNSYQNLPKGSLEGCIILSFCLIFPIFRKIFRFFRIVVAEETPVSAKSPLSEINCEIPVVEDSSLGSELLDFCLCSSYGAAWVATAWFALKLWDRKNPSKSDFLILGGFVFWFIVSAFCQNVYPMVTSFATIVGVLIPLCVKFLFPSETPLEKKLSYRQQFTSYVHDLSNHPGWLDMKDFIQHDFLNRKREKLEFLVAEILWILSICFYRALRTKYQPLESLILFGVIIKAIGGNGLSGLIIYFGVMGILTIIANTTILTTHIKYIYGENIFKKLGWNMFSKIPIETADKIARWFIIGGGVALPAALIVNNEDDKFGLKKSDLLTRREEEHRDREIARQIALWEKHPNIEHGPLATITEERYEYLRDYRNHTPSNRLFEKAQQVATVSKEYVPFMGKGSSPEEPKPGTQAHFDQNWRFEKGKK